MNRRWLFALACLMLLSTVLPACFGDDDDDNDDAIHDDDAPDDAISLTRLHALGANAPQANPYCDPLWEWWW